MDSRYPEPGDVFALANAHHFGCKMVESFIDQRVRQRVEAGATEKPASAPALGLLLRVIGWLRTAAKLTEPGDFQAAAAGARAMFEIGVDLTLLQFDKCQYPIDKLLAWERSARFNLAAAMARYVARRPGADVPVGAMSAPDYVKNLGQTIEADRAKYWPPNPGKKAKHPSRWTNRTLDRDAEEADRLADRGFVDFYENRYRQICLNTHGSGLAGVIGINMDLFPALTLFAFDSMGQFGIVAAEMALRFVGKWDNETKVALEDLSRARTRTVAQLFGAHRARQSGPPGVAPK